MTGLIKCFFILCIVFSASIYAENGNPTFNELKSSLMVNLLLHKKFLNKHKENIIRLSKKHNKFKDYSYAICGHLSVIKNDLEQIENVDKKLLWDLTRLEIMLRVSEYHKNRKTNVTETSYGLEFQLLDLQINNKMPIDKLEDVQLALEKLVIEYEALTTMSCRQETIDRFNNPKIKHQFFKKAFDELVILIDQYEQKVLKLPASKFEKIFVARQLNLGAIQK